MGEGATSAIAAVQDALLRGDFDGAKVALAAFDCEALRDADLHLLAARLAEDAGELARAVLEYNHALRDRPDWPDALRRLGQLRLDLGQADRATRCFRRLVEVLPEDAEAARELQRLLAQSGPEPRWVPESQPAPEPEAVLTFTDADAINLCARFSGREGVYARQWVAPSDRSGYTPVHEPFTPAVARKHFLGEITVGVYVVRLDQSVNFLAFDLDLARFAVARSADSRTWTALQRTIQAAAVALQDRCAALDLPAHIEDSGQKGRHVWILFDRPVAAGAARQLAKLILEAVEPIPGEVSVEVFPKQSRVGGDGLGNLIKIPLGVHRKTGRRSVFLRPDGSPEPDQLGYLARARAASHEHVYSLLERRPLPAPVRIPWDEDQDVGGNQDVAAEVREQLTAPAAQEAPGTASAAEAPYDRDQDEEYLWLLGRCPVLGEIASRAASARELTADERVAFAHSVGHLSHGPEAVNSVLGQVAAVLPGEFLKSRLRGNPISCRKVLERVPHLAEDRCACRFDIKAGYPTPLLHLQELRARGTIGTAADVLGQLQVERLVNDLIRTRVEAARLARVEASLQDKLREYLRGKGLAEILTPAGTVRLGPGEGLVVSLTVGPAPVQPPQERQVGLPGQEA